MNSREQLDIQWRLDSIRKEAEELHALLLDKNPETAVKFRKIGNYVGKLSTCLRVNGQLPMEAPTPPIVQIGKVLHAVGRRLPKG